ncbi:carbohydrate kinase family protein [Agarivorans sp. Toyoura001]|uniref:carbohydrate kinase family protein n=1 Tax=unclassified Agarivorans TaxID=2636026 RepID=UPI0010D19DBB|nr:carbohydrate kinase [Agarivorans sp. Toyoura001]GDY26909.1 fructokinase [Agarivorans sp. Toyoura001]
MSRLLAFGEVLVDWIPLEFQRQGKIDIPIYGQYPGGAPANVAVAVAGLGQPAYMLGQLGEDAAGVYLRDCLQQQQVNCDYLLCTSEHPTPMAFVSLDASGERSFSFHRNNSADLKLSFSDFPQQLFSGAGLFHICSNTLTEAAIADTTLQAITAAKQGGMLVSFDVNLRLALWPSTEQLIPRVMQAAALSDMLKLSLEEWNYLAKGVQVDDLASHLFALGVKLILLTDGAEPVQLFSAKETLQLATPKVDVVDTTGAGDAFTGAWLASLIEQSITDSAALEHAISLVSPLADALNHAVVAGALAVTKRGAWSALPSHQDIQQFIQHKE